MRGRDGSSEESARTFRCLEIRGIAINIWLKIKGSVGSKEFCENNNILKVKQPYFCHVESGNIKKHGDFKKKKVLLMPVQSLWPGHILKSLSVG